MAGVVRAHVAAKEHGLALLIGSQFEIEAEQAPAPFTLIAIACNGNGYGNLCEFITRLRRASDTKGSYRLRAADVDPQALADCVLLASPRRGAGTDRHCAKASSARATASAASVRFVSATWAMISPVSGERTARLPLL